MKHPSLKEALDQNRMECLIFRKKKLKRQKDMKKLKFVLGKFMIWCYKMINSS